LKYPHPHIQEAFTMRQLSERQGEKLFPAGETLHPVFALVALDTLIELITNDRIHDLRKDVFSLMHRDSLKVKILQLSHAAIQIEKYIFLR